ncbi:MAG: hypothetical protein QOG09_330 [Solirubrobacterales bacterium]|jgi:uncharacterized protein (DUF1800 family)|nr:hypothetical protein [Solirubrobacterales bacterium]
MVRVSRYRGRFGPEQAERLLWRAGFGPRPGEAKRLSKLGLERAVRSLTRPGATRLVGPAPRDNDGLPLAPYDAYGHDLLFWLDRMVRTSTPLVERMALTWHDWFATGDVGSQRLGLGQTGLFRKRALGSFKQLLLDVTHDPAMLIWLSGNENSKDAPNENYARELMELFTLGASNSAGYPYSEEDVREQARALTGWRNDWDDNVGPTNFRYDPKLHDDGVKRIFGQRGKFGWADACSLVVGHRAHAGHFVNKLWSYFVPTPPSAKTRKALVALYKYKHRYAVRPVVEAILMHPAFYGGSSMVKPPVVYIAGMLRARGRGIDTESWTWLSDVAGQRLFEPPNVAGWDERRWLDTSTLRGRWNSAAEIVGKDEVPSDGYSEVETPAAALAAALSYWGNPTITSATRSQLTSFAQAAQDAAVADWQRGTYRALRQNALRLLIATSPDMETC